MKLCRYLPLQELEGCVVVYYQEVEVALQT